jgi:hypothetical protein
MFDALNFPKTLTAKMDQQREKCPVPWTAADKGVQGVVIHRFQGGV